MGAKRPPACLRRLAASQQGPGRQGVQHTPNGLNYAVKPPLTAATHYWDTPCSSTPLSRALAAWLGRGHGRTAWRRGGAGRGDALIHLLCAHSAYFFPSCCMGTPCIAVCTPRLAFPTSLGCARSVSGHFISPLLLSPSTSPPPLLLGVSQIRLHGTN